MYRCPIVTMNLVNDSGFFVAPELFGNQFVSIQSVLGLFSVVNNIISCPQCKYNTYKLPLFVDHQEYAFPAQRLIWIW